MDDSDTDDELFTYFMKPSQVSQTKVPETHKPTRETTDSKRTGDSDATIANYVCTKPLLVNYDSSAAANSKTDTRNTQSSKASDISDNKSICINTSQPDVNTVTAASHVNNVATRETDSKNSAEDTNANLTCICEIGGVDVHANMCDNNSKHLLTFAGHYDTNGHVPSETETILPMETYEKKNVCKMKQLDIQKAVDIVISDTADIEIDAVSSTGSGLKLPTSDDDKASDNTLLTYLNAVHDVNQQTSRVTDSVERDLNPQGTLNSVSFETELKVEHNVEIQITIDDDGGNDITKMIQNDNSERNSDTLLLKSHYDKETHTTLPISLDEKELKDRVVATTLANIGHDDCSSGTHDVVEIILLDLVEESAHTCIDVHDKNIQGRDTAVRECIPSNMLENTERNNDSDNEVSIMKMDRGFRKALMSKKKGKENSGKVKQRGLKLKDNVAEHSSDIKENKYSPIDNKVDDAITDVEVDVEPPVDHVGPDHVRLTEAQSMSTMPSETMVCKHMLLPRLCALCKLSNSPQKTRDTRKSDPLTVDRHVFDKFEFHTSAHVRFERKHNKLTHVVNVNGHSMETEILSENNGLMPVQRELDEPGIYGHANINKSDTLNSEITPEFQAEPTDITMEEAHDGTSLYTNEHNETFDLDDSDFVDLTESILSEVQYDWEKQTVENTKSNTDPSQSETDDVNELSGVDHQMAKSNENALTSVNYYEDIMTTISEHDKQCFLQKSTAFTSLLDKRMCQRLFDNTEADENKVVTVEKQVSNNILDNASCNDELGGMKTNLNTLQKERKRKQRPPKLLKVKLATLPNRQSKSRNNMETEHSTNTTRNRKLKSQPNAKHFAKNSKAAPVAKLHNINKQNSQSLTSTNYKSQRLESIIIEKFQPLLSLPEPNVKEGKGNRTQQCANKSKKIGASGSMSIPNSKKSFVRKTIKPISNNAETEVDTESMEENKRVKKSKANKKKLDGSESSQSLVLPATEKVVKKDAKRTVRRKASNKSNVLSVAIDTVNDIAKCEVEHQTDSNISSTNKVVIKSKFVKKRTNATSKIDKKSQKTKSKSKSKVPQPMTIVAESEHTCTILGNQTSSRSRQVNAWKEMLTENAFNMSIDDCVGRKPVNIKRIVRKILGKPIDRSRRRRERSKNRTRTNNQSTTEGQCAARHKEEPVKMAASAETKKDDKHIQSSFEKVVNECKTQTASDFPGFNFYKPHEKCQENALSEITIFDKKKDLDRGGNGVSFTRIEVENRQESFQKGLLQLDPTQNSSSTEHRDGHIKASSVFDFQKRLLSPSKARALVVNKSKRSRLSSPFSESTFNISAAEYNPAMSFDLLRAQQGDGVCSLGENKVAHEGVKRVLQFPDTNAVKKVETLGPNLTHVTCEPVNHHRLESGSNPSPYIEIGNTDRESKFGEFGLDSKEIIEKCASSELLVSDGISISAEPAEIHSSTVGIATSINTDLIDTHATLSSSLEKVVDVPLCSDTSVRTMVDDELTVIELPRGRIGTSLSVFEASSQTPVFAERHLITSHHKRTVSQYGRTPEYKPSYFKKGKQYPGVSSSGQVSRHTTDLKRSFYSTQQSTLQKSLRKHTLTRNAHASVSKSKRRCKLGKNDI